LRHKIQRQEVEGEDLKVWVMKEGGVRWKEIGDRGKEVTWVRSGNRIHFIIRGKGKMSG
jgi:hypothetical protein